MEALLAHQSEIKQWVSQLNQKIYELETLYLEEPNSLGNIVRGWDPDGRTMPLRKGACDDKDRLFSGSSFPTWIEIRAQSEGSLLEKRSSSVLRADVPSKGGHKHKRLKRAQSTQSQLTDEGWDAPEEF